MLSLLWPNAAAMVKTGSVKTLLIADPHIGWEMELQEKGIHVPSQTPKILNKLTTILCRYKPQQLVIVGDVKYSVVSSELSEWHDVPDFFTKLQGIIGEHCSCPRKPRRKHRASSARKHPASARHWHNNRRRRRFSRTQMAITCIARLQNAGDGAPASSRCIP